MTPSALFARNADTQTQRRQVLLALLPAALMLLVNYPAAWNLPSAAAAGGILITGRILLPLIFGGLGTGTLNPYAGIAAFALFALDHHKAPLTGEIDLALAIGVAALALLALDQLRWRIIAGFLAASTLTFFLLEPAAGQSLCAAAYESAAAAHSLAFALMPLLLAHRETSPYRPRATWLIGGAGGLSYALLCINYAPLFAVLVACTLAGLLQPALCEIERRLRALPHFWAAALCVLSGLVLASRTIAALGTSAGFGLGADAGFTLCCALLFCSALAGGYAKWVEPRLHARRQQRLDAEHESLAAANSLVLRARVTGALHRRQGDQ